MAAIASLADRDLIEFLPCMDLTGYNLPAPPISRWDEDGFSSQHGPCHRAVRTTPPK